MEKSDIFRQFNFSQKKTVKSINASPSLPDVLSPNKLVSLSLNADPENNQVITVRSFDLLPTRPFVEGHPLRGRPTKLFFRLTLHIQKFKYISEQRTLLNFQRFWLFQLSFLLLDGDENFQMDSEQSFVRRLGCLASVKAKVVSIVGNTGEGKSYCLNRLFFR